MSSLTIKAVTEDNLDQLLALVGDYQHFSRVATVDREHNRQFFSQFIPKPEQGIQHLGMLDGASMKVSVPARVSGCTTRWN
jgi:hypothetical protein